MRTPRADPSLPQMDFRPPRRLAGGSPALALQGSGPGAARRRFASLFRASVVLSCGYLDRSLRAHAADTGQLLQSVAYTQDILTCVSVSEDGQVVACGSRDTTVALWSVDPAFESNRDRGRGGGGGGSSGAGGGGTGLQRPLPLAPRPRLHLYGHREPVECVAVSSDLGICVSGGSSGLLLFHSLATGRLLRRVRLAAAPSDLLIEAAAGVVVVSSQAAGRIWTWTVNGRPLAQASRLVWCAPALAKQPDLRGYALPFCLPSAERERVRSWMAQAAAGEVLHDMRTAAGGRYLLTAGSMGAVTIRSLATLELVMRYGDGAHGPLTSLAVASDDSFMAGSERGSLLIFSADPRRSGLSSSRTVSVAREPRGGPQ